MQYLLQKDFQSEVPARKKYLYKIFNLWFTLTGESDNFIIYTSIPSSCYSDLLFIVGHNYPVLYYLLKNDIIEKTIVAITCDGGCNFNTIKMHNKVIYLSFQNKRNFTDLLSGEEFGFDFDLTESELLLYNSPHYISVKEKLSKSFQLLNNHRRNTAK